MRKFCINTLGKEIFRGSITHYEADEIWSVMKYTKTYDRDEKVETRKTAVAEL